MKKKFVTTVIILLALITTSVSAAVLQATTAPNIKIVIDGVVQNFKDANGNKVDPVVIDGVTYLPLRSVADAFGKEVSWDGNTSTITIGDSTNNASANLIDVTSANAKRVYGSSTTDSSYVSKVSGEASLTFSNIGDGDVKFQSAIKIIKIDNAKKEGYYELNGSYKTMSCTLLFVPDADTNAKNDGARVQITNLDTGVDIVNQTIEPNKLIQINDVDITGVEKINFAGTRTTLNWNGTVYILNPIVK